MEQQFALRGDWTDLTEHVVHFTTLKETLLQILSERRLKAAKPFGWVYRHPQRALLSNDQSVACLTEVPKGQYERMMARHGNFGIVFLKPFVVERGGSRVWYVDRDSDAGTQIEECVTRLVKHETWSHPFWSLTPFFEPRIPGRHQWDWEREWRVAGDLTWQSDTSVVGLLAPAAYHPELEELGFEVRSPVPD